mmetsp:Transcript_20016/g.65216  ORF Transcript_20016/g.65216 Transcript_20016/m.65216 type:complete len:222 (+) Transcript_20016:65-730(+)
MTFKVAIIFFSRSGRLVTLANIIAEGVRKVEGAQVKVFRVKDPVNGDVAGGYEEGVLDAPAATPETCLEADCIVFGAPGRQGRICAEMCHFLDQLAKYQEEPPGTRLKSKVGACFTSVGGNDRGYGGHEVILSSFIAFFLQHGMIPVGVPPTPLMEDALMASPFGSCMAGKPRADKSGSRLRSLSETEVKLAFSQGEWAALIAKQLHDTDEMTEDGGADGA